MTMMLILHVRLRLHVLLSLGYFAFLILFHVHVVSVSASSAGWTLPAETTAVVTGGTKGIGRAIVEELISHGCRVLTCSRNQEDLQELLDKHPSSACCGLVADVATQKGRETLVEAIREHFGSKLDILVNNVGTNVRKASVDYNDEDVQHVWNTNFNSMFALTTACHAFLKRSDGTMSSVVNIGSVAGVTCIKSGTPYAATKAAMNQVTGNWACEWGPDGIRVNCVTPWYINTPLAKQVLKNETYRRCGIR
jgi:Tropinone reductase 1